jgi:DNA-binding NtrC family response regulator
MNRPCFLVVDREYSQSISTRKLVIETAKFNVITAYSAHEAIELLERFPAVDGIVVDSDTHEMPCAEFIRAVKKLAPTMPVIDVCTPLIGICPGADYHLETYDPAKLLSLLEGLRPTAAAAIEKQNEELKAKEMKKAD